MALKLLSNSYSTSYKHDAQANTKIKGGGYNDRITADRRDNFAEVESQQHI
jgi:hypothetical protein